MRLIIFISVLFARVCLADPSLFFVSNEGQWEGGFAYRYEGGGGSWFVTSSGLTIDLKQYLPAEGGRARQCDLDDPFGDREREPVLVKGHVLKVNFVNGNPAPELVGEDKLSSYSNYFLGRDNSKWRSRVGHFQRVIAEEVWPGIDVEYRVQPEGVETVFRVKPGADVSRIRVEYEGLDAPLVVDGKGELILQTSLVRLHEQAPFAYQIEGRRQQEVPVSYRLIGEHGSTFAVDAFDSDRELVIDPLLYGSYLGSDGIEDAQDIDVYVDGGYVVCGSGEGNQFPTTPGAYLTSALGHVAFLARFSHEGDSLIFSTYVGAPNWPIVNDGRFRALSVSTDGSIWCTGSTYTPEWPVTEDAIQDSHQGGADVVLCQLSADGANLLYSTFLGGGGPDIGRDAGMDESGTLYVCGYTLSNEFPITADALFPSHGVSNAFLVRFDSNAYELVYSTFFPGNDVTSAYKLAVMSPGVIWMTGDSRATDLPVTDDAIQPVNQSMDGFVTLWDLTANELRYCSYSGGGDEETIADFSVVTDSLIVVVGLTQSLDFPTTEGVIEPEILNPGQFAESGYVTVMNPFQEVVASTYFGSAGLRSIALRVHADVQGVTLWGQVSHGELPVTAGAFDSVWNDGTTTHEDAYVARLNWDLSQVIYCTYLGGAGTELWMGGGFDENGNALICGQTGSLDFPLSENAFDSSYGGVGDAFLAHFQIPSSPPNPPFHLTIRLVDSDVFLSWYGVGYSSYRVFSLPYLNFPYPYCEGSTPQTTLTIPDALQDLQRVYFVVGVE